MELWTWCPDIAEHRGVVRIGRDYAGTWQAPCGACSVVNAATMIDHWHGNTAVLIGRMCPFSGCDLLVAGTGR